VLSAPASGSAATAGDNGPPGAKRDPSMPRTTRRGRRRPSVAPAEQHAVLDRDRADLAAADPDERQRRDVGLLAVDLEAVAVAPRSPDTQSRGQ